MGSSNNSIDSKIVKATDTIITDITNSFPYKVTAGEEASIRNKYTIDNKESRNPQINARVFTKSSLVNSKSNKLSGIATVANTSCQRTAESAPSAGKSPNKVGFVASSATPCINNSNRHSIDRIAKYYP